MNTVVSFAAVPLLLLGLAAAPAGAAENDPNESIEAQAHRLMQEYAQGRALYDAGRYREAFVHFLSVARQGLPQAKMSVAYQYEKGLGVMPTPRKAMSWYLSAADDGYVAAWIRLALAYRDGDITRQNAVLGYALGLAANRFAPNPTTTALVSALREGLTMDQARLAERIAAKLQSKKGAISHMIHEAERIGTPNL